MLDPKPYILIAEDDLDDAYFFESAFTNKCPQVQVKHISNGESVLEFLETCPADGVPSMMLLDYKMPLASAADILKFVNNKEYFAPVTKAVWSTSGRPAEIEECRSLGADHFFVKPASESEWDKLILQISQHFSAEQR